MKKIISVIITLTMILGMLAACGNSSAPAATTAAPAASEAPAAAETPAEPSAPAETEAPKTFKVGICNYVKDASLDQIVENVEAQLQAIGEERGVTFEILEENCMADAATMEQIISNFISKKVDLMVGVATPVAMRMQGMTDTIPVIFSAVSDPVAAGLVQSLEAPGANITGTSDFLNTNALLDLIFAANPDAAKIGLLYDQGQDSSTTPIKAAKEYLDAKGIAYVEATGTTTDEVKYAVDQLISAGVDAVFTPTDNTIMTAELSIYEKLAEAKIPHYCGADSFALNGAFAGYGVDYANLGKETANMVAKVLLDGTDPATLATMTFDNGTVTVNTEICEAIGLSFEDILAAFEPLCTAVKTIVTANSFSDVQ